MRAGACTHSPCESFRACGTLSAVHDGVRLLPDPSVAGHLLTDLPQWRASGGSEDADFEALSAPLLLIDTAGCDMEEVQVCATAFKYQALTLLPQQGPCCIVA